ncbi:MAG: glycosyltransferase family 2 protein [Erysipelotrichaceae bacterium]|nr:glycosyltransferase family 2 protein [Erysipelotrichaceae bacterium]MDY5251129.1 glycosyltransferase family A protein [Erysipelotrichaceae bacterium]
MAKITVVVPIYNVEKYLRKCFDSLLEQTFDDFVVMAVNDGSPDDSQTIIDEYVNKYPQKIIGIKKPNGGYGSVLQMAIARMESEYFLVCDPDDYLAKDALAHLYQLASIGDCDLVIGAKNYIYDGSDRVDYDLAYNKHYVHLDVNKVYKRGSERFGDLLFVDPSPHSKLYRQKLAANIKFPTKVGYTDNLLFYVSLLNSNNVIYTDQACAYYLIDRPGNSMSDVSPKAIDGNILVFKNVISQCAALQAPDMFYYRMFESYKFILRELDRMLGDKEDVSQRLNSLYGLVELLIPYRQQIFKVYGSYSKAKIVEKIKDRLLLEPKTSKLIYKDIMKKKLQNVA